MFTFNNCPICDNLYARSDVFLIVPLKQMLDSVKNIMNIIKESDNDVESIDEIDDENDEDIRESKKVKIDFEIIEIENTPKDENKESNSLHFIENEQDDCIILDDDDDEDNRYKNNENIKSILEGNICKINDKIESLQIIHIENLNTNSCGIPSDEIKDKVDDFESMVNHMEIDLQINDKQTTDTSVHAVEHNDLDLLTEAKNKENETREDVEILNNNDDETEIHIEFDENIQTVNHNRNDLKEEQTKSTDLDRNMETLEQNNDIQVFKKPSAENLLINEISLNIVETAKETLIGKFL